MKKKWISGILLLLTLSAFADTQQSKLSTINKNIASIKTELQAASIQKSHLQTALEKTETTEGQINQQLQKTQQNLSQQQKQLETLKQQSVPLENAKDQNRAMLKQQLRAAYLLSQEPYLKLLLAPNDVTQSHRLLMYFHYITTAQMQLMTQLQQSIIACQNNQEAIQQQYTHMLTLKQTQIQNQHILQKTQTQRQQLIETIDAHIQTKHQKLVLLMHDKSALENTLEKLTQQSKETVNETSLETHFHAISQNKPFAQLQGKLSWPARGNITHQFGTQVYQSELRWDGTVIDASAGEAVHAVAAGRVIFAKWMAGYGLLLIINHGNGYMSLYGRNESLTKKVGDFVKANEVIANIGKSGGFRHDALYFSIRHNAKALNPASWCH